MSDRNFTILIWICWIILRTRVDAQWNKGTGHDDKWREWDYNPPSRYCSVNSKSVEQQSSAANQSQNNQCDDRAKSSDLPPSWLQHNMTVKDKRFFYIYWNVSEVRENFTLILLARPHVKNQTECACDPRSDVRLLKSSSRDIYKSSFIQENVPTGVYFAKIFTGCYYFVMKSSKTNKSWLSGPYFYTTYDAYDMMLTCDFVNASQLDSLPSQELAFKLNVPTTCIVLHLELWEIDKEKFRTVSDDLYAINSPSLQRCKLIMNNDTKRVDATCTGNDTNLKLLKQMESRKSLLNDSWSVQVVWRGQKRGDVCYFIEFSRTVSPLEACRSMTFDLKHWSNYAHIGRFNLSCPPDFKKIENPWNYYEIASILVAVLLTAVLLLWMFKFLRIRLGRSHVEITVPVAQDLVHEKKSNKILIIYTKGPRSFMERMRSFRDKLQERCSCPVYDLQSDEDNDMNVVFGSNEWIDRLLKYGCRIIWVDTPQFRLLVNNDESNVQPDEEYGIDFRDTAIPIALATAKTLYQDPITQYRDHFIVRWKGLEVTDGPDDPLAVISPHTRFLLPEHFEQLCSHLMA